MDVCVIDIIQTSTYRHTTSVAGRNTLARHVWRLWSRSPRPDAFFIARTTLCVIRYDHLAMKLGLDVQERKFNQWLWTLLFGLHVRYGALIQCGGESATDLQAVRYRARANWIGPEPDSVLRSVRSLKIGDRPFLLNWPNSSEKVNLLAWKLLHLQKFKKWNRVSSVKIRFRVLEIVTSFDFSSLDLHHYFSLVFTALLFNSQFNTAVTQQLNNELKF